MQREKRVALMIGNGAYHNTVRLQNPSNDAAATSEVLARLDFEVLDGRDLKFSDFAGRVRDFDIERRLSVFSPGKTMAATSPFGRVINTAIAAADDGMRCARSFFMRAVEIIERLPSKSSSSQVKLAVSAVRAAVRIVQRNAAAAMPCSSRSSRKNAGNWV